MKLLIWRPFYRPFILGGDVHAPVDMDLLGEIQIGATGAYANILSALHGMMAARHKEAVRKHRLNNTPMPWCEPCGSYHAEPRDAAMHASLKCKAEWKGQQ